MGPAASTPEFASFDFFLSLRGFLHSGFPTFIRGSIGHDSLVLVKSFHILGSILPALGTACSDSTLFLLDFMQVELVVLLRSFGRLGFLLFIFGFPHAGSFLLLRSLA